MEVAAAQDHDGAGQHRRPGQDRGVREVTVPGAVEELGAGGHALQGVQPRAVVGDGVVDGHEAAAALDLLHPGVGLVAEVDDADLAPGVGVPGLFLVFSFD